MTRAKEAEPRWGLQSPFLFVPLLGHTPFSQSWPRTSVLGGLCAGGLLLGGIGQALCACLCKRTEVRGYVAPVPHSLSKKERSIIRAIEAEPRWGLQSLFLFVPLLGHTPFSQSWPRTSVLGGLWAG